MKMKLSVTICLLMLGLLLTGCHKKKDCSKVAWFTDKVADKLDLNDEQMVKYEKLRAKIVELHKEEKAKKAEKLAMIEKLLLSNEIDQKKVLSKLDLKIKKIETHAPEVVALFSDLHKSLTQEQKEELVEILNKFRRH